MPLSLTLFSDSTPISASDVRSKIESIEDYVNTGIVSSDLKDSSPWVSPTYIYKPEFYGSPSPRAEMISGDTWYRQTGRGRNNYAIFHPDQSVLTWLPVHGLGATIRNPRTSSRECFISASFYAFTLDGADDLSVAPQYVWTELAASLKLFLNESAITGTEREIYSLVNYSGGAPLTNSIFGRENISMTAKVTLTPGTHQVSVRIKLVEPGQTSTFGEDVPDWKHIFIANRSMVIDVPHLGT